MAKLAHCAFCWQATDYGSWQQSETVGYLSATCGFGAGADLAVVNPGDHVTDHDRERGRNTVVRGRETGAPS